MLIKYYNIKLVNRDSVKRLTKTYHSKNMTSLNKNYFFCIYDLLLGNSFIVNTLEYDICRA